MKIMTCPLNGPRNISEFVYGGQVKAMPDNQNVSDAEWAHYVFYEKNDIGIVLEWWMHAPVATGSLQNDITRPTRLFAPTRRRTLQTARRFRGQ